MKCESGEVRQGVAICGVLYYFVREVRYALRQETGRSMGTLTCEGVSMLYILRFTNVQTMHLQQSRQLVLILEIVPVCPPSCRLNQTTHSVTND